jgi:hypothetical protein
MKKSKDQIPAEFKSIEQIQDFWNTHSSADYWAEMEDVPMKLSPELKAKLELKKLYRLLSLSKTQIKAIERKAQSAKVDARRLMSKWITAQI